MVTLPSPEEVTAMTFAGLLARIRELLETPSRFPRSSVDALISSLHAKLPQHAAAAPLPPRPNVPSPCRPPEVIEPVYRPSATFRMTEATFDLELSELHTVLRGMRSAKRRKRNLLERRVAVLEDERAASLRRIKNHELSTADDPDYRWWREQVARRHEWQRQQAELEARYLAELNDYHRAYAAAQREAQHKARSLEVERDQLSRQIQVLRRDCREKYERLDNERERVPWVLLPTGREGAAQLRAAFLDARRQRPDLRWIWTRIKFAESLGPQKVVRGTEDFTGYFAFIFQSERKVLLEHPAEGNAAYVFGRGWRPLSRLSKKDLLSNHHHEFIRVVHRDGSDWQDRIRQALREIDHKHRRRSWG